MVAVLGKELKGPHKNKYNICCGKGENTNCYIINAIRELYEEFHIEINIDMFFEVIKRKNGEYRISITDY